LKEGLRAWAWALLLLLSEDVGVMRGWGVRGAGVAARSDGSAK
jgi:hypothetical protein